MQHIHLENNVLFPRFSAARGRSLQQPLRAADVICPRASSALVSAPEARGLKRTAGEELGERVGQANALDRCCLRQAGRCAPWRASARPAPRPSRSRRRRRRAAAHRPCPASLAARPASPAPPRITTSARSSVTQACAALGEQRHRGLRVARDVGAGRRDGAHRGEPRGEAHAGDELFQHRLPALAAGDDREAAAQRAGLQDRGVGHADHRHRADLLQRREAGIAEAGEHDGVLAALVVGEGIDRRVAGDGVADARGDVARPEGAETARRMVPFEAKVLAVLRTRSVIDCRRVAD